MVNSVGFSNVSFQGAARQAGNRQYMQTPYQQAGLIQPEAPVKKSSGAKKGIIGTLVGLVVAAGALYAGVKSGKLTEVANPTKWTEKLQNYAFKGGSAIDKGVQWIAQKGKNLFNKKAPAADTTFFPETAPTGNIPAPKPVAQPVATQPQVEANGHFFG